MRTHTCGELTEREEGERVVLVGWLQSFRKIKGGLAFATLRDAYGETQIMKPSEVQLFERREKNSLMTTWHTPRGLSVPQHEVVVTRWNRGADNYSDAGLQKH